MTDHAKTEFHTNTKVESAWTILGLLNPVWNARDGGEFFLEDHKVEYKAADSLFFLRAHCTTMVTRGTRS